MNKYITLVALLVTVLVGADALAANTSHKKTYKAKVGTAKVTKKTGKHVAKGKSKASRGIASVKKKAKRHPRQQH